MAPPNTFPTRTLGKDGPQISAIGFGLMGMGNTAYGSGKTIEERLPVLDRAWELGCTNWDSADAYGDCEELLGKWFQLHPERRKDIFLSTKFGLKAVRNPDNTYSVGIDSSPEYCREALERSMKRLGIDCIDLYYIHRLDQKTPIEKTMRVLKEFVEAGKIKYIGISEGTSTSIRRAYKIHPIHAVQIEYNPWDLDIETEHGTHLLKTCRELGITTFAFAPLGRGILTGQYRSVDDFAADDSRRWMPRYVGDNFQKNLEVVDKFKTMAEEKGATAAQLAIAWVLAQGDDIIPIPGTKSIKYLEENLGAAKVTITPHEEKEIRKLIDAANVAGKRVDPGFLNIDFLDTPEE